MSIISSCYTCYKNNGYVGLDAIKPDRLLVKEFNQKITHSTAGAYTDQAGNDEAVIDDEFADVCGAGAVKTDAGQVTCVCRQDEVAVAGGEEGDHHQGIYAEADP